MNLEQARELYSDYIEGTLDAALKSSLETELTRNPAARQDFESFKSFYGGLNRLCDVKVPVNLDVEERVKQRLDLRLWESNRKKSLSWFAGFRGMAVTAAVLAVVSIGVIKIRSHSVRATQAGIGAAAADPLITAKNGKVTFQYDPVSQASISITDCLTGKQLDLVTAPPNQLTTIPFANQNNSATAVTVSVEGVNLNRIVVLPGMQPRAVMKGKGSLVSFAKALADTYREPVCIIGLPGTQEVVWSFSGTDPREAAFQSLQPSVLTVDRINDLIRISKH